MFHCINSKFKNAPRELISNICDHKFHQFRLTLSEDIPRHETDSVGASIRKIITAAILPAPVGVRLDVHKTSFQQRRESRRQLFDLLEQRCGSATVLQIESRQWLWAEIVRYRRIECRWGLCHFPACAFKRRRLPLIRASIRTKWLVCGGVSMYSRQLSKVRNYRPAHLNATIPVGELLLKKIRFKSVW